jgi:integration host factor subunit beta
VPSKRLPFFKVGKELKELVNTSRHSPLVEDEDDEPESSGAPAEPSRAESSARS